MGFILKVYILGLVAFLPSPDGTEMTVLMVDARDGYALSDGTWMETHEPLLLARAARCQGDCRDGFHEVAEYLYQGRPEENVRQLESAILGGATWPLDGSELSFQIPTEGSSRGVAGLQIRGHDPSGGDPTQLQGVSQTPREVGHFDWVAEIAALEPGAGMIDPDVLAERPEKGLIVARMKLATGEIRTERLVTLENQVVELKFRPLRREKWPSRYSQALADRVVAEISVPGCEVILKEDRFDGAPGRSITLAPEACDGEVVVEVVLVNLPHDSFAATPSKRPREEIGKHFEMFYELAYLRPPNHLRPVPFPSVRLEELEEETEQVRGRQAQGSMLLPALGLPRRGAYSRPICPMVQFDGAETGVSGDSR
jgi:hypothetical protein